MTRSDGVVVAGVGETEYSRRGGRPAMRMALEAIHEACADAGILPSAIDGIVTSPTAPSAEELAANLGLSRVSFHCSVHMGGASSVAGLRHAALSIGAGLARHVLLVQARNASSGARIHHRPSVQPSQQYRRQLEVPYGWNVPAQRYSMICRRYMHEYGLTREQLGIVAVSASRHAQLDPHAQNYGRELSMEQYLAGRPIADPYTRYDCCLETDGACAIVVSAATSAPGRRWQAEILSVGEGRPSSPDDLTNRPDFLRIGLEPAAADAWEHASLGPEDMDAAMIYDCFTFQLIHQLEAVGFAPRGEGASLCRLDVIGPGGRFPVNTHGGLLAGGHLVGLNHVVEATRQLRGEAGARQLENARHIAVTGWGDLGDGSLAILRRVGSGV
jgi:acetyl-CoA acetyltransferase